MEVVTMLDKPDHTNLISAGFSSFSEPGNSNIVTADVTNSRLDPKGLGGFFSFIEAHLQQFTD